MRGRADPYCMKIVSMQYFMKRSGHALQIEGRALAHAFACDDRADRLMYVW
ncbi:hypothetical protein BSLA_03r0718 [Burkholderia stabilis]|nr:hypothetical protein BSLA_03r0718 [Burkholderia stabilis]